MQRLSDSLAALSRVNPLDAAFFFDFDGTLVELAGAPDRVVVEPVLIQLLDGLRQASHGALAVVSGRGIDSIDTLLASDALANLPIAGLHGAERRDANGDVLRVGFNDPRLAHIGRELERVVSDNPGMLLEIKGAALALHYRNAPDRERVARRETERLCVEYSDAYVLQPGKMVYEIKPKHVDKGRAIAAFLDEPPFVGRVPVFAGDDLTDEKGFDVVNARGGVSIKIGDGNTRASTRLPSVAAFRDWLATLIGARPPRA
ncbi:MULTISPECIES: trehalose-phosphatase [Burkholderiaceae]|uniref:trehalose-phosphatase n=1 Tax=Burkholderiaceae TaxID=119060 RepID=UPI000963C1D4|nr:MULTISPECIES: trehalose-phosphatase [Burkholderiaceae]MCG1038668.1 trehalose-phosphatase [Mycetohabitans sp. B7]SIT81682.1 trehalose 6-phosphatase [Burkholderia sp. b14]